MPDEEQVISEEDLAEAGLNEVEEETDEESGDDSADDDENEEKELSEEDEFAEDFGRIKSEYGDDDYDY